MVSTAITPHKSEAFLYWLYYGPLRRIFRGIIRRLRQMRNDHHIWYGPLKGRLWFGQEMVCGLGIYEMDAQMCLVNRVKSGDVFYDIGAKSGFFALLAAQLVGNSGKVIAFEPLPDNRSRIEHLLSVNQISNVVIAAEAISSAEGTAELYVSNDASTPTLVARSGNQTITVQTTTLDAAADLHQRPDFVKMDIEGAEVMALEGASELLASSPPITWLIECHSAKLEEQVTEIMRKNGYNINILLPPYVRGRNIERHLLAWKE